LRNEGFRVSSTIEHGDAKSKILEAAAMWAADLIVMGSHKRDAMDCLFEDSVSAAVARHAKCSVEIGRTRSHAAERAAATGNA
jgi:nucleotide-binding universal stress UspA family protein